MTSRLTFSKWRYFRAVTKKCSEKESLFSTRHLSTSPAGKPSPKNRPLQPVIGLEIHAQIKANTKLFSGADSGSGNRVNSNVSHFDAAIPGTLPVINRRCVEAAVSTSLALGCKINLDSRFDRKHYFYADMPAGYQITQHFSPIAREGKLDYVVVPRHEDGEEQQRTPVQKSIRIIQVQIEQDSGKSIHDAVNGVSLIDLNRAGQGLLEIVTAPGFEGSEDAVAFAYELKLLLECLGVIDCKVSGQVFRVDANVSLHREGEPLGVRTEIKNMNSLKDARKAIDYEISRQRSILESGGQVVNETLGFDRFAGKTLSMRDKEIVTDYRFFPEPNLPPLRLSTSRRVIPGAVDVDVLAGLLPEFPEDVRRRLIHKWGLTRAQSAALVAEDKMVRFFEGVMESMIELRPNILDIPPRELVPLPPPPKPCSPEYTQFWPFIHPSLCLSAMQRVAEILLKRVLPILDERSEPKAGLLFDGANSFLSSSSDFDLADPTVEDLNLTHQQVAHLAVLIEEGRVSPAGEAKIVRALVDRGNQDNINDNRENNGVIDVEDVITALDLWMTNDDEWIRSLALVRVKEETRNLMKDNPKKNARGKMNAIGRTLKDSGLSANPLIVKTVVEEEIRKLKKT